MSAGAAAESRLPLCVDLDGTLVATDTLWESLLSCARRDPARLLRLPLWLVQGRSELKARLARHGPVDPAALPYREDVVAYAREARETGRPVVLATAAAREVAEPVADHLGLFERVFASDAGRNLKGARKRDALCEAFGEGGFEYVGDGGADGAVWRSAGRASCVGISAARRGRLLGDTPLARVFESPRAGVGTWLRALRVHQWVKNLLVFLPLVMSHRFLELPLVAGSALAFLCMSLMASAVYLFNDLLDLPADRLHPTKCHRPFASGRLPLAAGLACAPVLVVLGLGIAAGALPAAFVWILALYLVLNALYSLRLKRVAMLDVILLAGLYALRVLAGGWATGIEVSPWLIGFSLFFFLNLAFLKRYADLRLLEGSAVTQAPGRDYHVDDAPLLLALGPAAGYLSVLVLALYVQSDQVVLLYDRPEVLWLLVPLMAYWLSRFWLIGRRGEMRDDPVLFTTRDPVSWLVAGLAAVVLAAGALL